MTCSPNPLHYFFILLKRTIIASTTQSARIELILKLNDRYRVAKVDYHGGLRYPHLERISTSTALLDSIIEPRN